MVTYSEFLNKVEFLAGKAPVNEEVQGAWNCLAEIAEAVFEASDEAYVMGTFCECLKGTALYSWSYHVWSEDDFQDPATVKEAAKEILMYGIRSAENFAETAQDDEDKEALEEAEAELAKLHDFAKKFAFE